MNNVSIPIGTTLIDIATLGKLTFHGFATGQPCVVDIKVIDPFPRVVISKEIGLILTAKLSNAIRCKRTKDATEFEQLFTLVTTPLDIEAKVEIDKNLSLKLNIT